MIQGAIEKPIVGIENLMLCRKILATDEQLRESADNIEIALEEERQELIDKGVIVTSDMINEGLVTGNAVTLEDMLKVNLDEYELFSQYVQKSCSIIGTKKIVKMLGVDLPDNASIYTILKINKDLQGIMSNVMIKLVKMFDSAMKEGTTNFVYDLFFDYIEDDMKKLPAYKYEVVKDNYASYEDYYGELTKAVENVLNRLYDTKYTTGILLTYRGVEEAKVKLVEIFKEVGLDIEDLINKLMPEQLISDVAQFHQALNILMNKNPQVVEIVRNNAELLNTKVGEVLGKLAEENAITKFNQQNGMVGNVYPTLILPELIATILATVSGKMFSLDMMSDLPESEQELMDLISAEVHSVMDSYTVNEDVVLNDDIAVRLISLISHAVSPIVVNERTLRSVDGRFQQFTSVVGLSIQETVNGIVEEFNKEYLKSVEEAQ